MELYITEACRWQVLAMGKAVLGKAEIGKAESRNQQSKC
jgi:hypothetical protein